MLLLAAVLVLISRRFAVQEDRRITQVEEMLPHTNCGACGYPGCRGPGVAASAAGPMQR